MFGRRNPDPAPAAPVKPHDEEIDLGMLPDLSDLPTTAAPSQTQPPRDDTPFERSWESDTMTGVTTTLFPPAAPEPAPFVPPSAPAIASAPAARSRSSAESVIGPDDFFDGNYRSERGVRLQGKVRGSIESRQYILVEAGAEVEANLSAEDITVSGTFSGRIECRHRLEISDSGVVRGQVETALLVVHEGGMLDGELKMHHQDGADEAKG